MPAVNRSVDVLTPRAVLASWLLAAVALPLALVLAMLGQAVGAMLGGCRWIGMSLPLDHSVWALVNQPTLDFAARPAAVGYWLGSLVLPLVVALLGIGFVPRPRSLGAELAAVQITWAAAVVAVAWLPLLDPLEGHLARWLALGRHPTELISVAPAVAAIATVPAVLRLLALLRGARRQSGRGLRLGAVLLHLVLPCAAGLGAAATLLHPTPVAALIGAAAPSVVALAIAWYGYPTPFVHPLTALGGRTFVVAALAAVLLWAMVWTTGRPLGDGTSAGVLWGRSNGFNNIRPWIQPTPLHPQQSPSLLDDPDGS